MGCRDDVNTSGESGHGIVNKAIAHESEIDNIINLNGGVRMVFGLNSSRETASKPSRMLILNTGKPGLEQGQ